jgi:preprotein translocase subunit SecE
MSSVITFLREVRVELAKVSWPTQGQLIRYTLVVVAVSVALAVYLGLLDAIFSFALRRIVS